MLSYQMNLGYYDEVISKKRLSFIIGESFVKAGNEKTVKLLDDLKDIGFKTATKSGVSISISDILIPEKKSEDHYKWSRETK